jgi:hypothetical protein
VAESTVIISEEASQVLFVLTCEKKYTCKGLQDDLYTNKVKTEESVSNI